MKPMDEASDAHLQRCTQCGTVGLGEGFVEDDGQYAKGYARWIPGRLERGLFGGARRMGRPRWRIEAFRCPQCGHLELFARRPA